VDELRVLAHGGLGGLVVELLPALAIVALALVVWLRSRKEGGEP
jgi:hypothetical protein